MQHVETTPGGPSQADHPLGRHARCFGIAPNRMRTRIALEGEMFTRPEPVFVFRVNCNAPPSRAQHRGDVLFVVEQQVTRRRTQKRLHASDAGHPLQLRKRTDVGRSGPDVERIVTMHSAAGASELVLHGCARRRRRQSVGHFEDAGHSAEHRRAAAAFKIFLVLIPRFAEMTLAVDDSRQNMQPRRVEDLCSLRVRKRSDGHDLSGSDTNIPGSYPVWRGHGAAPDYQIEGLRHVK